MLVGDEWLECLVSIPLIAVVPFALITWAMWQGAPTNLTRAAPSSGCCRGHKSGQLRAPLHRRPRRSSHSGTAEPSRCERWKRGPHLLRCWIVGAHRVRQRTQHRKLLLGVQEGPGRPGQVEVLKNQRAAGGTGGPLSRRSRTGSPGILDDRMAHSDLISIRSPAARATRPSMACPGFGRRAGRPRAGPGGEAPPPGGGGPHRGGGGPPAHPPPPRGEPWATHPERLATLPARSRT